MGNIQPEYVFETSWEVCNKIGGIHTVLATKARTLENHFKEHLIFIGPDLWKSHEPNPEFREDSSLFPEWREAACKIGLPVKIGHWQIIGEPITILVDFTPLLNKKNKILAHFWTTYQVDSLTGSWDYVEATLFGYAVGKVIAHFLRFHKRQTTRHIAHFHEWMTGAGILYLKEHASNVATVFTTHATVLGRSLAGNNQPLYDMLPTIDPIEKAKELNIISKSSLERTIAHQVDCLTTVSSITARECGYILGRQPDVVTPNGFEPDMIPTDGEFENRRSRAREVLRHVAEALLGHLLEEDTLFLGISGRYEIKNKGIDLFLETLRNLKQEKGIEREVIAYILVPGNTWGPRPELQERLKGNLKEINNTFLTHGIYDLETDGITHEIKRFGLENGQKDKIKVIFVPCYLKGDDGIFNLSYYDLLIGMDLTIFPSYYEPWGYTPLESIAFSIPTITTSLAGFGQWALERHKETSWKQGVGVIQRTDHNAHQVCQEISTIIKDFLTSSPETIHQARQTAREVSKEAMWNHFIENYINAYQVALTNQVLHKKEELKTRKPIYMSIPTSKTNMPVWKDLTIKSKLPEALKGLDEIARNLWWTWNYETIELFKDINENLWRECNRNPVLMLQEIKYNQLEDMTKDSLFMGKLERVYTRFRKYVDTPKDPQKPHIAYFSMEYGLSDILKTYSGGLGVLAGDYLKEASDCNENLVAVGLLYSYGYFTQTLSIRGEQQANYEPQDIKHLPIQQVMHPEGGPQVISVNMPGHPIKAAIWKVQVGRISLYLLDTDISENEEQDRQITHQLYGGDWENRLKQEILLGFGGIRALRALGHQCDLYHCNEGHAAFINVERLAEYIHDEKMSFVEAAELVRASSLFTTHTPVPAGHDSFNENLVRNYLRHTPERLGISWNDFLNLGKENQNDPHEKFSMSVLAAKTSHEVNGVSRLHKKVTQDMFNNIWKGYFANELHISYVTNGVHFYTWTASEWQKLYKEYFGPGFHEDLSNPDYWEMIYRVPDERIWALRTHLRQKLVNYIRSRFERDWLKRQEDPSRVVSILEKINPKALTIGFGRRFATYKRAHLLFKDLNRLSRIVNNEKYPVQFIFTGKAHPADGGGQALIQSIVEFSRRPEFLGKVIFLENYDMAVARRLVSGVDIWLNTPTRPLEASGTSGEKAEMNGVLNLSVLDGWWAEGYKEGAGWALNEDRTYDNQHFQDELDSATLYGMLENEIIPLFYHQNEKGYSPRWIQYIKNSIAEIAPHFTTKRMLDDYKKNFYSKQFQRIKLLKADNNSKALELAQWKQEVAQHWGHIEVVDLKTPAINATGLRLGGKAHFEMTLNLHELADKGIDAELVVTRADDIEMLNVFTVEPMKKTKTNGSLVTFSHDADLETPGSFRYALRVFPVHPLLPHRLDFAFVYWA